MAKKKSGKARKTQKKKAQKKQKAPEKNAKKARHRNTKKTRKTLKRRKPEGKRGGKGKGEKSLAAESERKKELKKYKGYYFALGAAATIFVLYIIISVWGLPSMERSAFAEEMSAEIKTTLSVHLADIDSSLEGEFVDTLEDEYLMSMRDEFEWLKEKEKEAYNSFPPGEVEYKEAAIYYFMHSILHINDMTSYDLGEPLYEQKISEAKSLDVNIPDVISDELSGIEEEKKEKIVAYFNQLFKEYIGRKKALLNVSQSKERKYVEAKKITYVHYVDSE